MKIGVAAGFRKPGKRQDGLADHPRDRGGPGEKGSASVIQSERSEHQWAFSPPLRLEISIHDLPKALVRVDVQTKVGVYTTMHRSVVVGLDAFGDVPLTVEADLYKWVAWLLAAERERHMPERKRQQHSPTRHPNWPSPGQLSASEGAN